MKYQFLLWLLPLLPAYPLLRGCSKGRSPVRTGLLSAALGFAGLGAACILSPVTGLAVSFNFFTCAVAALMGLPGVVCVAALAAL